MGDISPERLAQRLTEEGVRTVEFFNGLPDGALDTQIYTEGSCWTVRQVLAHQFLAEESMVRLIRNILQGGSGTPEDFDLDAYNERKVAPLRELDAGELLTRFQEQRRATIQAVLAIPEDQLALKGRHPFLGLTEIREIIKMIYRHNQIHIREVRRALQAGIDAPETA